MAHHHTISGLVGKLVTEVEVNYNADKYYQIFKHHEEVPKAIPHVFMSMKVVEGHGMTSGCIKEWNCIHEGRALTLKERTTYDDETRTICHSIVGGDIANVYKKFHVTLLVKGKFSGHASRSGASPWQESTIACSAQPAPEPQSNLCKPGHAPHLSLGKLAHRPHLSHCEPTNVAPAPLFDGHTVMWIIDYEKIDEDSPVPITYLAFFHRIIQDLNPHFCASNY